MSTHGCSTAIKLYKGRDNAITIIPYSDVVELVNYDMTGVTRVTAHADLTTSTTVGDAIVADSPSVDPTVLYWDTSNPEAEWHIYCKVGLFTGIAAGEYTLRITIYDIDHPNGLVLPDTDVSLRITIVDLP